MPRCPVCKSYNVSVHLRSAGTTSQTKYYRTGIKNSWFFPAGTRSYKSQRHYKSIYQCNSCGHIWEDPGCLFYLICFLFFPITLSVLFYRSNAIKIDKRIKALILILFWIVLPLISSFSHNDANIHDDSNEKITTLTSWKETYEPLESFDYYVDQNEIHLKKYEGKNTEINIAPTYVIDNIEMRVVSLESAHTFRHATKICVPEGVTFIERAVFNSCGAEYYYLPSTLNDFDGWSYFDDVEKIYYGGTEDQWAALFGDYDRSSLEVKRIICNASPNDLP